MTTLHSLKPQADKTQARHHSHSTRRKFAMCPNPRNFRRTLTLALCAALALAAGATGAAAWRIYDTPLSADHQTFGRSQPQILPIYGNAHSIGMSLMAASANQQQQQHQVLQPVAAVHQMAADLRASANAPMYAIQADATPRPPQATPVEAKSGASANIDASAKQSSPATDAPAQPAPEPTQHTAPAINSRPTSDEPTPGATSSAGSGNGTFAAGQQQPWPVGKILGAVAKAAVAAGASGASGASDSAANASTTLDKANIAFQMLKPRKHSHDPSRQAASSAEQQIINQHARLHPGPGSHQRLLATKQRDNKIVSALVDSASASSASAGAASSFRDSPLFNYIFGADDSKSGISSRSSIVKAISDNKVARTLTSVGKSISGNKYLASAAAASALAALGLTVGKLLSPYLYAGSYSKLGDPMMSSGSLLSQAIAPNAYMSTDRNLYYQPGAAEPLLVSGSAPLRALQSQAQFGAQFADLAEVPLMSGSGDASSPAPAMHGYYPAANIVYSAPAIDQQFYAGYGGKPAASKLMPSPAAPPKSSSASSGASLADTNGHYTGFYAQHGAQPAESDTQSGPFNQYPPTVSDYESSGAPTYVAYKPLRGAAPPPQQQHDHANHNQANSDPQSAPGAPATNFDQVMSSSTLDAPLYSSQPQPQPQPQPQYQPALMHNKANSWQVAPYSTETTGRRSGAMSLKMDNATRARLYQQLAERYRQQQVPQTLFMPAPLAASELGLALAGGEAQPQRNSLANFAYTTIASANNNHNYSPNYNYNPRQQTAFVPIFSTSDYYAAASASPARASTLAAPKASRAEPNGNHHGPAISSPGADQHEVSLTQQGHTMAAAHPSYSFIRPNTGSNEFGTGDKRDTMRRPEPNVAHISAAGHSSPWRSVEAATAGGSGTQSRATPEGQQESRWSAPAAIPKQTNASAANHHADDHHQSTSSGLALLDEPLAQPDTQAALSAPADDGHLLQRVSRTPNQSSVTHSPKATAAPAANIDNSSDYDSETSNGANEVSQPAPSAKSKRHRHTPAQQGASAPDNSQQVAVLQPQAAGDADGEPEPVSPLSAPGESARANFVPLENDNDDETFDDKNNVIKIIEANTSPLADKGRSALQLGATKLTILRPAQPHYGSSMPTVLMLPKSRPLAASFAGRLTGADERSSNTNSDANQQNKQTASNEDNRPSADEPYRQHSPSAAQASPPQDQPLEQTSARTDAAKPTDDNEPAHRPFKGLSAGTIASP